MHSSSAHSTAVLNLLHSATVTLASAGRGARPKRKLTAVARESWTIESSSSRRQQPNSERRTRSSTHTVNLPLLPAETANDAYGPQNSGWKTSLGPESSFLIQSLRSIMTTGAWKLPDWKFLLVQYVYQATFIWIEFWGASRSFAPQANFFRI